MAGRDLGTGDGVQSYRHGLGEGGPAGFEAVGYGQGQPGRQHQALGVGPGVDVGVPNGVKAALVGHHRHRHDDVARCHACRVRPQLQHLHRELVAHHHVPVGVEGEQ